MKRLISLCLSAAMLLAFVPAVSIAKDADITEGLIAYYDFETDSEQPSEIADVSGNENNATVLNTTESNWWGGTVDNHLTVSDGVATFPGCTGDDWGGSEWWSAEGATLKLPNGINEGVTDFTYSAWIKADSDYKYASKMERFFDFGNIESSSAYNSVFVRYTPSSGQIRVQDRMGSNGSSSIYKDDTLSDKPFNDAWGLLTVTFEYDGEKYYKVKTYINGELDSSLSDDSLFTRSLTDLGTLTDDTNGLFIGRTVWTATSDTNQENPDFCGQMDEIRLYNRAISEEEIAILYNTTSPVGEIKMASFTEPRVTVQAGDYPVLPETVSVTYNTGYTAAEKVTWETLTSDKYSEVGTVSIKGTTEAGNAVTAKLIITAKDSGTLSDGLILNYTFDSEDEYPETISDVSGNGNDGTVYNTSESTWSPWGDGQTVESKLQIKDGVAYFPGHKKGSDLGLSGREGNEVYSGAAIKLPTGTNEGVTDFTYSAWIYADTSYRYNDQLPRLFDFGAVDSASTNSIFYRYQPSSGESRFQDRYIGSSADDATSYISATLEDKPFNDEWAMLTVTYEKQDGDYYLPRIYINGEERTEYTSITTLTRSLTDLGTLTDDTNGLWIGRTLWNNSDNPDFCGKMDEIRLYNRALSAEEVAELYAAKVPSDVDEDLSGYEKTEVTASEDITISGKYPRQNLKSDESLMASSTNGAAYTRYVALRFSLTDEETDKALSSKKTVLKLYVYDVGNSGENNVYLYGLTGDNDAWDIDTVTYNNYAEQIGGSISNVGVSEVGELIDTETATGGTSAFYMEWDVTEFLHENAGEHFSFIITAGSNSVGFHSADRTDGNAPTLVIYENGTPITVVRKTADGETISETTAYGTAGQSYTYNVSPEVLAYNDEVYVYDESSSTVTIDEVAEGQTLTVVYKKATDASAEESEVKTYVGAAPSMPRTVTVTADGMSAKLGVTWDTIDSESYAQKGEFDVSGTVIGTNLTASAHVTVFPNYNNSLGGDLTITVYVDGEEYKVYTPSAAYGSTFTLEDSYAPGDEALYELEKIEGDASAFGDTLTLNELGQHIELYYKLKEKIEGSLTAEVRADDIAETSYSLRITASAINNKTEDTTVSLVCASYDDKGILTAAERVTESVPSRTGETVTIEKKIEYTDALKTMRLYFWDNDTLEPLAESIAVGDLEKKAYFDEEVINMMPTYDGAVEYLRKANDYWQAKYSYDTETNGIDTAFWARAAYHTGNMEAVKLLDDETYLGYSVDWANYNNWMGNDNTTADPSEWTWGYNQTQGSNAVLFGDWQTCFQTYLDLAELGVEDANTDRVYEVMDYQISKDEDSFWWWADSLYMVMPVMTKLYKATGDEKYLDALYKYFKYAKELMYDGPGGIPTDESGYTTSASKKSGAAYSDPDDYKYLFYRDANYCYPLNAVSGHESEKNFWARGNGWVFAGLAKVLSDMPETYEHYDEFKTTYLEMAPAIMACQQTDSEGHGFWTQSMLLDYPKGNNGNDEGYETSGTAFLTYGLFWGINNGLLDAETYLEAAVRGYGYLNEVALQSDGKVGYVQEIGSNATKATAQSTTQDFGVGAFLLADCEAARWAQNNAE